MESSSMVPQRGKRPGRGFLKNCIKKSSRTPVCRCRLQGGHLSWVALNLSAQTQERLIQALIASIDVM